MIRPYSEADREWARELLTEHWGGPMSVSRGRMLQADELPGFVYGDREGLATYRVEGDECELVTINSLRAGGGTALIEAVAQAAREAGCRRLWLITTNDNTPALRFYQRRGFQLAALHRNAIEESRRLKPSISLVGIDGIPIRDELELELEL